MMERETLTPMRTEAQKRRGAVGRPTWRSSLLNDPGARFLWKTRAMGEKQKKRRIANELCATGRGPNVAGAFTAHRAGRARCGAGSLRDCHGCEETPGCPGAGFP